MVTYRKIYNDCDNDYEKEAVGYEVLIDGKRFETCDFCDLHETMKRAEQTIT